MESDIFERGYARMIVNNIESLRAKLCLVKEAQEKFSTYTQEQVDKVFLAAATEANKNRIRLAKMAVAETDMGIIEDKVIKNHFAAEYVYNAYRHTKTCGVIEEDIPSGSKKIAEPVGVIAAIIPTTNPTSTAIFKALLALKTRNAIIFSPHPTAKKSTIEAAKVVYEAARKAGAPENIIAWIDEPSLELSIEIMKSSDLILATGGPSMVKSAYSSGKPAIGVGNGNTPAIIDDSADLIMAVNSIIHSKTFDHGTICASEQSVIVLDSIYHQVKDEFLKRGCYFLNAEETNNVRKIILNDNGGINAKIVGKSPYRIAALAGFEVPKPTRILIGEVESADVTSEPFAHEKLSPILAMYRANEFNDALSIAEKLVIDGGIGHTSVLYANELSQKEKIDQFSAKMKTCRILINTPSSHGGIGDLYNFRLLPSLTLGCGTWGGNSVSENVGIKHLLNIKTVAQRRENMLWFRTPQKVYFKQGCLPVALQELKYVLNKKRAFIVTDSFLYQNGYTSSITTQLNELGIQTHTFFDVEPDPTLTCATEGASIMKSFNPDVILAVGGGSAMDAGKIMWLMYEHPEVDFADLAMRFMDIRKRIYTFPKMGEKAYFVAIPTTSGTGSEVTPFAIITDEKTSNKYAIADYALMPNMAICDVNLMMKQPKGLTAASGIDALTHALESYVSILSTDYTEGIALKAIKLIFDYLPRAYENGESDPEAREKIANAATLAGMAFANSFLGVCHSLAHKLGAFHHIQHGVANALLITEIMKFNICETAKMGTLPQYKYPQSLSRYAEIANYLGLPGKTDTEKFNCLINAIEKLKEKVSIPKTIQSLGIHEATFLDQLDAMVEQAFDDQCTGANPRYPMMHEIKAIYLKSYYGK